MSRAFATTPPRTGATPITTTMYYNNNTSNKKSLLSYLVASCFLFTAACTYTKTYDTYTIWWSILNFIYEYAHDVAYCLIRLDLIWWSEEE